jgi:23S rRNA (cytidine1920-2'-O)/16S rRNA (cytidine1409-2'-O)-methyltransferase
MAADILVNERVVDKPGTLVDDSATIRVLASPPFVSRGGLKLAHALDEFKLDVTDMVAADIGASTGGFTDCLLQRGTRRVYAIDVGYGQLDYRLRIDRRVVVIEKLNARYPFELPEVVDLATVDVSFISLQKVLPNVVSLLKESGCLVVLVKPQFEARREQVGKGGLVKDPLVHAQVLGRFILWSIDHHLRLQGLTPSPILGAAGNREFFVLLTKH